MTAATDLRARVDDQAIGTGTTIRFALLVVLLLAATTAMAASLSADLAGGGSWLCQLAAGADPDQDVGANALKMWDQWDKLDQCIGRYEPPPPWWLPVAWMAVEFVCAAGMFLWLPVWKLRRSKIVGLEVFDPDGDLQHRLQGLVERAGLARTPRFVVDRTALSSGAVVFGRTAAPTVCLDGGLVASRDNAENRFRAVVLHELAHIHNRDVTATYLTVVLWRVFLALLLLPYTASVVVAALKLLTRPHTIGPSTELTVVTRNLALAAFLTLLIYLARADLLRHREICADRAAVRWGADPRGWVLPTPAPVTSRVRAALRAFAELWRTHPRWDLRRAGLQDPAQLFGVRALPLFLTGAIAMLIATQSDQFNQRMGALPAVDFWVATGVAVLVTAVAGIALCRAVIYADLTDGRIPSGWLAGLWLGLGLAVSDVISGTLSVHAWIPPHPWVLLIPVITGILFGAWTVESSVLWSRVWRGRSIRPVPALALIPAGLGLAVWFVGWGSHRTVLGQGVLSGVHLWQRWGFELSDHVVEQTATDLTFRHTAFIGSIASIPLAITALWAIPLWACAIRRTTVVPEWIDSTLARTGTDTRASIPLPSLRVVLWPALIGTLVCWLSVLAVQAYMHRWRPDSGGTQQTGFEWVDSWWLLITVVMGAATAVAVTLGYSTRFSLIVAIVAGYTTVLIGSAGILALTSADGCIRGLAITTRTCGFRPRLTQPFFHFVPAAASLVALLAGVAVGLAALVRGIRQRSQATRKPEPLSVPRTPAATTGPRQRVGIIMVSSAVIAVAVFGTTQRIASLDQRPSTASDIDIDGRSKPVSIITRALQVGAWGERGGEELLKLNVEIFDNDLPAAIVETSDAVTVDMAFLRVTCTKLGQGADDADRLFRIPDPDAQKLWQSFLSQAHGASKDCLKAIDNMGALGRPGRQGDPSDPLALSLPALFRARSSFAAVLARITEDVAAGLRQS
ncbi:M48 family metalloprotease [Nocardia sp. CWNU-33]|uniref:M48 family metalloprotease n=1 Tax=Nocardia sp. CWNU-33 TaxID=3392117 RepID=UPI00398E8650